MPGRLQSGNKRLQWILLSAELNLVAKEAVSRDSQKGVLEVIVSPIQTLVWLVLFLTETETSLGSVVLLQH